MYGLEYPYFTHVCMGRAYQLSFSEELVFFMILLATEATSDESRPPDSNTLWWITQIIYLHKYIHTDIHLYTYPHGRSDISRRFTARSKAARSAIYMYKEEC